MDFDLYVTCRRGGITRDAGRHTTFRGVTETEAHAMAAKEIRWLRAHYDEISYELREAGVEAIGVE